MNRVRRKCTTLIAVRAHALAGAGGAGAAAGDIGSIQDCAFEGQLQLGAMTISDSGAPQIVPFETPLNHSFVYTLRISFQARASSARDC
jgi:hypothetical protein